MGYNAHMIYIASKTIHAPRWRDLRACGAPIISTWIDEAGKGESPDLSDLWMRCISESSRCRALVAYREPGEILKGTFIEIGCALSHRKPVFLVGFGDGTLSFVNHPLCTQASSIEEAIGLARWKCL